MLNSLPQQYREDPWIIALCSAIRGVMERQEDGAKSVTAQESLDTVTWNLDVEERLVGIVPLPEADDADRRSALKAKWRSGGRLTIEQIQAVADAWRNGAVEVSFPSGRIRVQFVGLLGVPSDLDSLKTAIRIVVPAHLPIDYYLRYLLIRDIHQVKTLAQMDALPLNQFAGGNENGKLY